MSDESTNAVLGEFFLFLQQKKHLIEYVKILIQQSDSYRADSGKKTVRLNVFSVGGNSTPK